MRYGLVLFILILPFALAARPLEKAPKKKFDPKKIESVTKQSSKTTNSVGGRGPAYRAPEKVDVMPGLERGVVVRQKEADGSESMTGVIPFTPGHIKGDFEKKNGLACPPIHPQGRLSGSEAMK